MQEVQLDAAINSIRVRFGSQALTRAAELPPPQPWPSRTPIDRLSGIGGLPCGRLTLLTGSGTCGKLTLALLLLAGATREFAHAMVIETSSGFDPWTLLPFYPELSALTVVRAPAPDAAGEATAALARAGAGFILLMGEIPEHWLGPLESAANRSGTVIVGVVDAPGRAFAHASSLSVGFSRTDWIWERGQLVGLRASARCMKNRVAPPLGETELEIRYPLGAKPLFDHAVHVAEVPAHEGERFAPSPVSPASRGSDQLVPSSSRLRAGQSWDLYQASAVV
jgi:recombination protein RecA